MKRQLLALDYLTLTDAVIEVELDTSNRSLSVYFESGYDGRCGTFVDGYFRLAGWESATVSGTPLQELPEISAVFDWIGEHETIGNRLRLSGTSDGIAWGIWSFEAYSVFDLEFERRFVLRGSGGDEHQEEVSLECLVSKPDKGGRLVLIETPDDTATAWALEYARRCVFDSLERGELPMLRSLALRKAMEQEGELPVDLLATNSQSSRNEAEALIAYTDLGRPAKMRSTMVEATRRGLPVIYRRLFEPHEAQAFLEAHSAR